MHVVFPPALVECLKSGKSPTCEQLGSVALHIWRDWCSGFGMECNGMPRDPILASYMRSLAWLAMTGESDCSSLARWESFRRSVEIPRQLEVAC